MLKSFPQPKSPKGKKSLEGIAKLLPLAVKQQLRGSEGSLLEVLAALWPSMVGRGIAKQCRPASFSSGTLTIATSCPTWAVQFRQLGEEIRASINRALGAELVKKLRVQMDTSVDALSSPGGRESNPPKKSARGDAPESPPVRDDDVAGIVSRSSAKYFARSNRKSR